MRYFSYKAIICTETTSFLTTHKNAKAFPILWKFSRSLLHILRMFSNFNLKKENELTISAKAFPKSRKAFIQNMNFIKNFKY